MKLLLHLAVFAALVALASAECPNACSGHGTCGQKDMCSCYNNYQGNDCSERTCYFGIAHVDTPKGDLNADGQISDPTVTVITGSEVYPFGTTEQYPNAGENEGHFYMECSNKGICDRKTGECECFDGYEGTACVRASCPNDCSGHGTCETIRELAEFKGYDTNAQDVPTTQPAGEAYDSIERKYAYDLWDADKTMGCKCDPVYYGADCSQKKCKYGVDPLFFDDWDGRIHQTTVVHLGAKEVATSTSVDGRFSIVFFDVFGEKYTTKPLTAKADELTALAVAEALEALPNGVISSTSLDVTRATQRSVDVSMHGMDGTVTTVGTLGAGTAGTVGAGVGSFKGSGPEFTITFTTNPGILRTIEIDTSLTTLSADAVADYWVANMRQGQFESRHTKNVGEVNTLMYGTKRLYTNVSPSTLGVAADDLIKVNGQEFRVVSVANNKYYIELSDYFLGANILPITRDTGATASAVAYGSPSTSADATLNVAGITADNLSGFATNAQLMVKGTPVVSLGVDTSDGAIAAASSTLKIESETFIYIEADTTEAIYLRSTNVNNQNFYHSESDSTVRTHNVCPRRGSSVLYACEIVGTDADATIQSWTSLHGGDNTITLGATPATIADHTGVFFGVLGPYKMDGANADTVLTVDDTVESFASFLSSSAPTSGSWALPVWKTKTESAISGSVTVLLINGRRYKIKETASEDGASVGEVVGTKFVLTETFSGQHLRELCAGCVSTVGAIDANTGVQVITVKDGFALYISKGQPLLVGGSAGFDAIAFAGAAADITAGQGTTDSATISVTTNSDAMDANDVRISELAELTGGSKNLWTLTGFNGVEATIINESDTSSTYKYVSQCSNRGTCDGATGLCTCFAGYTNDNCDTQNMLAV